MSQSLEKVTFSKTYFDDWCSCVNHYNMSEELVKQQKTELFDKMKLEIKKIFSSHLKKDVRVRIRWNGELILVDVPVHMNESLKITEDLISDLIMPVCIRQDNPRNIIFELYPQVDVESKLQSIEDILDEEVDNTS